MSIFPPIWNGTLREHYLLLFAVASALGLTFGMAGAWLGAHLAARRAAKALRAEGGAHSQVLERQMGELARAVDAIAIEVERISEAQRYSAQLLTERGKEPPALRPMRRQPELTTPH
jgi:hypothetical protein